MTDQEIDRDQSRYYFTLFIGIFYTSLKSCLGFCFNGFDLPKSVPAVAVVVIQLTRLDWGPALARVACAVLWPRGFRQRVDDRCPPKKRMKSPLITTKTAVGAAMTTNTDHGGGLNPRVTGLG